MLAKAPDNQERQPLGTCPNSVAPLPLEHSPRLFVLLRYNHTNYLVISLTMTFIGFYTISPTSSNQLILGPFHGKPACQTIASGRGACGTAAVKKPILCVHHVNDFPGHIACDGDSVNEIVVPVRFEENESPNFVYLWQGR